MLLKRGVKVGRISRATGYRLGFSCRAVRDVTEVINKRCAVSPVGGEIEKISAFMRI
jgi:hypothetical protein